MKLSITRREAYAPPVEFVERKGVGHPDTICDHLAEELAKELATEYLSHTGAVQHFNVDKAILAAGSVDVGFGGGEHTRASRLVTFCCLCSTRQPLTAPNHRINCSPKWLDWSTAPISKV